MTRRNTPIRTLAAAIAVAVLTAACSGASTTTTTGDVPGPTSTLDTSTSPPSSSTSDAPSVDPQSVLDSFVAALNRDDVDAAMDVVDPGATWSIAGFDLVLDAPLPTDLAWLAEAFGLAADRTGRDVMEGFLALQAELRTRRTLSGCETRGETVRCLYDASDALTGLTGRAEAGDLVAAVDDGLLVVLVFNVQEITGAEEMEGRDDFLRWAYVEEPSFSLQSDLLPQVDTMVVLLDTWTALGRPDVPSPLRSDADPLAVIDAWLEARNSGDWAAHVALLAESALDQELGSRDDFLAHAVLERTISLSDCEVTLETLQDGVVVACVASVDDVITRVVGQPATNPNATSLRVRDGRITSLPEFIPSHARAEKAIETWATTDRPAQFTEACPDGISNPFGTESLTCATFMAEHVGEWAPQVRDAYAS